MKYRDIKSISALGIRMELVCAHCGERVAQSDFFCRVCGHKLSPLKEIVAREDLIALINDSGHLFKYIPSETVRLNKEVDEKIADIKKPLVIEPKSALCMHRMSSASNCPYVTVDGYCTRCVCTSMPPQYQKCSFFTNSAPEFKRCSDVGKIKNEGNELSVMLS